MKRGWKNLFKVLLILACIGIIFLIIFLVFLRPWFSRMGASSEEVTMALPSDDIVKNPGITYTQAITINAPRDIIWAYLIQVGYKRAGWYNADWINGVIKDYFYEGGKSANRIIPELQNLKEGDTIFLVPAGGYEVLKLDNNNCLLLTSKGTAGGMPVGEDIASTWVFVLQEIAPDKTRLITRNRSLLSKGFMGRMMDIFIGQGGGPGIQQPAMLKGIKKRAEAEYKKSIGI